MLKEEEACGFLERTGYTVVERNFRSRSGEIDVVARLGDMLVFVEVRYRKAGSLVGAEESVTCGKARRIRMAVKRYLCVRGIADSVPVRVDLCVVRDQGQLFEIVPGIIEFG